ncbi:MAG: protein kinase [Thermonemataceae bacterium]|nr:protein kinase [Thermonemataceae bacterium]
MEIGKAFYQYQILSLQTEDNLARNWLAQQNATQRNFLIKQIKKEHLQTEQAKLLLRAIASKDALLKNHHFPVLYDYMEVSEGIFFVYQQAEGVNLEKFLLQNQPNKEAKKDIFVQLLDAFVYLHHLGRTHLSLSPQKIMVNAKQKVHIIDTGLGELEQNHTEYQAPEQKNNDYADTRTDIFALGKILALLFPETMGEVVRQATQTEPYKRYQSVEALKKDFLQTFFSITHQNNSKKNVWSTYLWGGAFLLLMVFGGYFVLNTLKKTPKNTKKNISFDNQTASVIKDTTDYTKLAKEKQEIEQEEKEEDKRTPEEKEKDSLDKIKKEKKKAREKRQKERKEEVLKKLIVDGQFVSNQLGEYKINVEMFNSNKEILLEDVLILITYYDSKGEIAAKEEKIIPKLAPNEAQSIEVSKKINASRFTCKAKDAKLPPDPNEELEEDEEQEK